ncbi:MAG: DUF3794 domain-containing protein [Mycobacterium leprae]
MSDYHDHDHEHHHKFPPQKHVIQVPVIVNRNEAQVLVVTEIPLTPPAFKIDEIQKLIEIDDCATGCDKVIINGRLIKNVTFKTKKEHDKCHEMHRVCGDVRHCTVEIPWHMFIDVKGAKPGDICEVEDAIVAAEFDKLIDKNCDETFNKLLEKVVIKVRAKVVRTRHIWIDGHDVTPPPMRCELEEGHRAIEIPGLDIPEEKFEKFDP